MYSSHSSRISQKLVTSNSGRVIITDVIASLIGEAWPQSMTPVNIMSGRSLSFLNPGAVSDRQIVVNPGTSSLQRSKSDSVLTQDPSAEDGDISASIPVFTYEEDTHYQTQYEERFDIYDASYLAWLRIHYPESACSVGSNSPVIVVVSEASSHNVHYLPRVTVTSTLNSELSTHLKSKVCHFLRASQ